VTATPTRSAKKADNEEEEEEEEEVEVAAVAPLDLEGKFRIWTWEEPPFGTPFCMNEDQLADYNFRGATLKFLAGKTLILKIS
jgi:hypothetical protein